MVGGAKPRVSSPAPGRSILITSAPRSASIWAQVGPASTRVRSKTRNPFKGPVGFDMMLSISFAVIDRRWIEATDRVECPGKDANNHAASCYRKYRRSKLLAGRHPDPH